jgi:hypothetical protein
METQITPTINSNAAYCQDTILLELHATRERLANEYGDDIGTICDAVRLGTVRMKKIDFYTSNDFQFKALVR